MKNSKRAKEHKRKLAKEQNSQRANEAKKKRKLVKELKFRRAKAQNNEKKERMNKRTQ